MHIFTSFKPVIFAISGLLCCSFIVPTAARALEDMGEIMAMTSLTWIKCNDGLRQRSSLYKEAGNLLRESGYDKSLLLNSRIDALAQVTLDEGPVDLCERFTGLSLKSAIIAAAKNTEQNLEYMATWKKKSAARMADYICRHGSLELTDSQIDNLYNDIIAIVEQEGAQRFVDEYAIESSFFEISEVAGAIAFRRRQNGTCRFIFN